MSRPQSFMYKGAGDTGVLLIHGFSGSTYELEELGQILHRLGLTVHAPLLKGHGSSPEEMGLTSWRDWWQSAQEGYRALQEQGCTRIFVIGHSMGGLLALKVAHDEEVAGLITLCAPIKVRDKRMAFVRFLQYVLPYKHRKLQKAEHIERHLYVYEKVPMSCVVSLHSLMKLVQKDLASIQAPILIIQSELDETVDPSSADLLYQGIGSPEKEIAMFKDSTHMITLDVEKEQVTARMVDFILHRIEQFNV